MVEQQQEKFNYNEIKMGEMLRDIMTTPGTIASCYRLFHEFSVRNQFLAYWQMKRRKIEVGPVACMSKWNKLGRRIIKGSKAIVLMMPVTKTIVTEKKNEETGKIEKKKVTFTKFTYKPNWFALSQTTGAELIKTEEVKCKLNFELIYDFFGIKLIPYDEVSGNCQGFAIVANRELAINPLASHPEMTIIHELAHILLEHHKVNYSDGMKEMEAESVAYIIGNIIGISEEQLSDSRGYIQSWFECKSIPEDNAKRIMTVANKLLEVGTGKLQEKAKKYGTTK